MLTSRTNAQIKAVEALRNNKDRKKTGLFLVEGEREISRAGKMEKIFYHEMTPFIKTLEKAGAELVLVSSSLLEKISLRNEIVGVAKMKKKSLSDLKGTFFIALVGIEKPGNIGAILRTCDGAGVDGVLLVDALSDHYHPNAIRASLGASFTLDIVTCSSAEAFDFIEKRKISLVITSPDAKQCYSEEKLTFPALAAFGQEDKGLPEHWMKGTKISIPMEGICDSLNVSVAAGIVIYEMRRQNASK